ncbi:MAG: YlbF family regulator [Gemmatimonadota bacterium]|nr:YlbF family regulator [Gemmatimonadota bacterium]
MEANERERIFEKASEVGRLVARTPEYRYLKAAHRDIGDDREATEMLNRMQELQKAILGHFERDEEPPAELRDDLEQLTERMQESARYQALIAAQTNFDKLMDRVNGAIGQGIRAGEQSGIIVP